MGRRVHAAVGAEQFGERTADLFKTFKDSLTEQPSKIYAEILYRVWSGEGAEELKLRATEDLSSQQPVPWLKYLQSDGAETQTLLQTLWPRAPTKCHGEARAYPSGRVSRWRRSYGCHCGREG